MSGYGISLFFCASPWFNLGLEREDFSMYYRLKVAGLERDLPLCKVSDDLFIAAFIMFGDVEMTVRCAEELLKIAPPHDVLITAESKGIPLLYEMARQAGRNDYIVARKGPKLYMQGVISTPVHSISTDHPQILCIGKQEAEAMRGKRVLAIDDVISTGESLAALETLIQRVGGNVVGKMAVLAEGEAQNRKDISCLAPLPLFHADGTPMD